MAAHAAVGALLGRRLLFAGWIWVAQGRVALTTCEPVLEVRFCAAIERRTVVGLVSILVRAAVDDDRAVAIDGGVDGWVFVSWHTTDAAGSCRCECEY